MFLSLEVKELGRIKPALHFEKVVEAGNLFQKSKAGSFILHANKKMKSSQENKGQIKHKLI